MAVITPMNGPNSANTKKVWLITGCSSGLGHSIAVAALNRGDIVVATARDVCKLSSLSELGAQTRSLDVTWSDAEISQAIADFTLSTYGRIDILVNNAGYILTGGVEECSHDEVQAVFNTNVFGQLNMIRAVLPLMRRQRSGVIANLGSIGGWHGTPGAGLYCATKACASLLSESLRSEVAHLGIKVMAIEPGYTRTEFLTPSRRMRAAKVIPDLAEGIEPTIKALDAYNLKQPGDPDKAAQLVVEALTESGRCVGYELPQRLLIGEDAYKIVRGHIEAHQSGWETWEKLATRTNHDDVKVDSSSA
ncbi:serine 3-dehydrogenase [Xylaria bambusicola]|uniref:serine 3-dehydrogenase n=1 Tax=Xylaria bambusicola TaxID=326684 RepID=UPI002007D7E5|nr:serine 3-dehydrogenase [Xylaria bambusicola]KAI0505631.1 serine 3-dehydrogenase [Xylaria bambusicola]